MRGFHRSTPNSYLLAVFRLLYCRGFRSLQCVIGWHKRQNTMYWAVSLFLLTFQISKPITSIFNLAGLLRIRDNLFTFTRNSWKSEPDLTITSWGMLFQEWAQKRLINCYVKSVTGFLVNKPVACPFASAILFHFQWMIMPFDRSLTSVAFKEAILAAVHCRNWIYLLAVQFWIKLRLLMGLQ